MSRSWPALAALALLAVAGCSGGGAGDGSRADGAGEAAVVDWVVDGDTVRLEDGRTVRLLQIDAPEARTECYGRDATRALIELTPRGTPVELVRDPALDAVDPYDRLLRYVLVDGDNVNVALVARGAAAPYFFRNGRGSHADALLAAARTARDGGRGLWAACPEARLEPGLGSVTGPSQTQRR